MQERHTNRGIYFEELSITSNKYYIPYIDQFCKIGKDVNVLEIGCGDGGNLLPFSLMGCKTVGIDIAESRIRDAKAFFANNHAEGEFIVQDIFKINEWGRTFDIILCHDVFEHIGNKKQFLMNLSIFLKPKGVVFMAFPAWQMPFGGHQQICQNRLLSHFPFIHLLPTGLYHWLLLRGHENGDTIKELLSIKNTKVTIESFERQILNSPLQIQNRQLWFINPHYEIKFGLHPLKLCSLIASIPFIRNFFSTSCFYLLSKREAS